MYRFDKGGDKGSEQAPPINNTKESKSDKYSPSIPPLESHVLNYLNEKGYSPVDVQKFFNYFQSNGWLVGGRSKIKE